MPRPLKQIKIDQEKGKVQAKFYELKKKGQRNAPRYYLCTIDELEFKKTARGTKKRTKQEKTNFLLALYEGKLQELQEEAEQVRKKKEEGKRIYEIFDVWLDNIKSLVDSGLRDKNTLVCYESSVEHYKKAVGDHLLSSFRSVFIVRYLSYLKKENLSGTTLYKHASAIQTCFNWALVTQDENGEYYLKTKIKIKLPKKPKKEPIIYSQEEIKQLTSLLKRLVEQENRTHRKLRFTTQLRAVLMAKYTGMRGGEIWSCRLQDISLEKKEIKISDKTLKIKTRENGVETIQWKPKHQKERTIPMNEEFYLFLENDLKLRGEEEAFYLDNGQGVLFYYSVSSLRNSLNVHCKELNILGVKPLHGIRATVITSLLEKGVDVLKVQMLAGHKDYSTTLGYLNRSNFSTKDLVALL
jgi:integrase